MRLCLLHSESVCVRASACVHVTGGGAGTSETYYLGTFFVLVVLCFFRRRSACTFKVTIIG
jgi:hypothetical protein